MTWKKLFSAALAAVVLSGAASVAAQAQNSMTLAMPTTAAPYLLPFFVAQDLGWYEKAGLKVKETVVTGDTNCLRAVITGDADTTYIGPNTIMQGKANGAKIKMIGSFQPIVDYRIMARKEVAGSLKDLSDKRWAISSVGGMLQALPKLLMKKHDIDSSKMVFMSVGGYAARYQALLAGTVDASLLDTMLMLRGEKDGRLKYVGSIADSFPKMGFVYFAVREGDLSNAEKRKALQIFMTEGMKGARYIVDHPREAAEIMEKRLKGSDVDGMTEVLKQMTALGVWGINGGTERDVFEFSEDVYRSTGEIKSEVRYGDLMDTTLADASVKELGKR